MIPARPSRYERQASSEYPNKSEPEYAGFAPPYAQGAAENLDLASAKGHVLFDEQADLVDEMTVPGGEERGNVNDDHDRPL
jgi:hypothetical protein